MIAAYTDIIKESSKYFAFSYSWSQVRVYFNSVEYGGWRGGRIEHLAEARTSRRKKTAVNGIAIVTVNQYYQTGKLQRRRMTQILLYLRPQQRQLQRRRRYRNLPT